MTRNFRELEKEMSPESIDRSETNATADITCRYHESRLRAYLRDKLLDYNLLWLSVEYFLSGAGRVYLLAEHPFTKEEWKKLLTDTNRHTDDPYLN